VTEGVEHAPDRMFIAQKMRILFKNTEENGLFGSLMKIISVPLTLIRDYTVPIGEEDQWDRQRAAIIPMTLVIAFLFLSGKINYFIDDEDKINSSLVVGLICMIPGAIIGVIIKLRTKVTEAPSILITLYSILCFIMSIMWIQFTCNCIMDLLQLFGFITSLPEALLALTIIAWGNCLGDMAADVAMTKKGFGEMAITGCIAGPIFNVLIGIGLSNTINILRQKDPWSAVVHFSIFYEDTDGLI
jgi:sodium/potassium/calcium exchanger 6